MIWTKVSIDGTVSVPAYLDPNDRWNGFARPFFRKEDVLLIQSMLGSIGGNEAVKYDADEDAFVVNSACGEEYDEDYDEWFYGTDIDGMHLYPIGAGSWVWLED